MTEYLYHKDENGDFYPVGKFEDVVKYDEVSDSILFLHKLRSGDKLLSAEDRFQVGLAIDVLLSLWFGKEEEK